MGKTNKPALAAILVLATTALVPQLALAQYKCTVNGKVVYADEPCASNARHVGAMQDRVDGQAQAEAEALRRKEAMQRGRIEGREAVEERAQQRAAQQYIAAEEQHARAKRQRCAALERDMKYRQRDAAFYHDLSMQRSLTQQEQELKRAQEAYGRECR